MRTWSFKVTAEEEGACISQPSPFPRMICSMRHGTPGVRRGSTAYSCYSWFLLDFSSVLTMRILWLYHCLPQRVQPSSPEQRSCVHRAKESLKNKQTKTSASSSMVTGGGVFSTCHGVLLRCFYSSASHLPLPTNELMLHNQTLTIPSVTDSLVQEWLPNRK